ncbi:MAG: 30S ribosomal protein S14 [Pseudomonadota bacterium]|nr:30S ribosomal protein S14 [Pseudomonadota bacterium]
MAKVSMIERERKRNEIVKRFAKKRAEIKARVGDRSLSVQERRLAQAQLRKLPRNASPTRLRNRCRMTGRPRGYYRKFGLGRNKLREAAMRGDVPGLVKSSW